MLPTLLILLYLTPLEKTSKNEQKLSKALYTNKPFKKIREITKKKDEKERKNKTKQDQKRKNKTK